MIDTTGWESGYYTIDFILAADKYRDLNVASLVNHVDVLVETCAMAGACRLKSTGGALATQQISMSIATKR
jgi:hypothetical protein